MRVFKKLYLSKVKKQQGSSVTNLNTLKRGRKLMLGEHLDAKVQTYVKALRDAGTPIGSSVVMAAGEGMVCTYDRTLLVKHGGYISITKSWAKSLLKRMGYVKRKATTKATPGMSAEKFESQRKAFLRQIARMVKLRSIPDTLVINLDQTGVKLVLSGDWTMAAEWSRRVEIVGLGDKRQITATFAATLKGTFLPMQILYQGKTDRCHPKFKFPDGFDILCHTPNHWQNEQTCIRFCENIIFPYVKKTREEMGAPTQKALLLMDNFSGQTTPSMLEKFEDKGIVVVFVPASTTDRLQPLDVSTNKSAKEFLHMKFRQWYASEVEKQLQAGVAEGDISVKMGMPVMKEVGGRWLTALYDKFRSEPTIITNGFKKVGIEEEIQYARENPLYENECETVVSVPPELDDDPFADCS